MTENLMPNDASYASKIAIVVNNQAVIILNATDSLYAAFKSNPIFVDLKNNYGRVEEGDIYNAETNTFSKPTVEDPEIINAPVVVSE
jgi:hypothetical protein